MMIKNETIGENERILYIAPNPQFIKDKNAFHADCCIANKERELILKESIYTTLSEANRKIHVWNKIKKEQDK